MKKQSRHFLLLCFISLTLLLHAGFARADPPGEPPPPRESLRISYAEEESTPLAYPIESENQDIPAIAESQGLAEGVPLGSVTVRALPTAKRPEDHYQVPREMGPESLHISPGVDEPPEIQRIEGEGVNGGPESKAPGDNVRQWTAISDSGWIPPDTIHAVGPRHIVEAVNSGFAIYTKLGTEVKGYTTFSSFLHTPSGWQGTMFDPRVIYEPDHDQFVMLVLGKDIPNQEAYYWIGVSHTSDPTGDWWWWRFGVTDNTGARTAWLDYAGLGADRWGIYVTGGFYYFSPKGWRGSNLETRNPAMFAGGASNGWGWIDLEWPGGGDAFALQPALPHTVNSSGQTFFVNTYWDSGNKVLLWKLSGDRTSSPTLTNVAITTRSYHAIEENVDQPGSTTDIDGGDARVMNAVYSNGRLFYVLTDDVNDDGTAAGWLTVKLNVNTNSKEWEHLAWNGTGSYFFYPAITLDGTSTSGNLAVFGSWTRPSTTQYASGIYAIYKNQPIDTSVRVVNMVSGSAAYVDLDTSGRNRWGDYSGASYDWECGHAWGAVESADTSNRWRTTIGARFFDDEPPCPLIEMTTPNGGEVWSSGTTRTIIWKRANLPASDNIYLFFNDGSSTNRQIAGPLASTATSFSWNVLEVPTSQGKIFVGSWAGAAYTATDWSDDSFTVRDATPPSPNPMTWSMEPYALNTSQIRMVANTATDSGTPPVAYYHDFTGSPTGGSGGTDSGWSSLASYIDSGLQANHQYCYRVRARDSAPSSNTTNYSTTRCIYTGNDPDGDGVPSNVDNCPETPNGPGGGTCSAGTIGDPCMTNGNCGCEGECSKDQEDADSDGYGDVCDNCPNNCNYDQWDADVDGLGDVCDPTPGCGCKPPCETEC